MNYTLTPHGRFHQLWDTNGVLVATVVYVRAAQEIVRRLHGELIRRATPPARKEERAHGAV